MRVRRALLVLVAVAAVLPAARATAAGPLPPPTFAPSAAWSESTSWSGYVIPSSRVVTVVSGSWRVPAVNCAATPNSGVSTWVGTGGFGWPSGGNSGTLLQTGVEVDCIDGAPRYWGWWEEYPSVPDTAKRFRGFPVSPGDAITASVYRGRGGRWATRIDDRTTGLSGTMITGVGWGVFADGGDGSFRLQGSTARLSYTGGHTAEWIVEDFNESDGKTRVPFADYGSIRFGNLGTSLSSWSLKPHEGVAMSQNGTLLSTPSQPARDGAGFSVRYTAS